MSNQSQPQYRNLTASGFGFINRLRVVSTDDTDYVSVVFNAQYGKANKDGKFKTTRFALNVKSSEADSILRDVLKTHKKDDKICARLQLGDLRPRAVEVDEYKDNKKTGNKTQMLEIVGSVIRIDYLSVNSDVIVSGTESFEDEAPAEAPAAEQEESSEAAA